MTASNSAIKTHMRGALTALAMLVLAGCQSLSSLPEPVNRAASEALAPAYIETLEQIDAALASSRTEPVPSSEAAYSARAQFLRNTGDAFIELTAAGSATPQEFPLWGDYFNALSDTVESVVAGDADLAEAERLYDFAAGLYRQFLERSHLPERPFVAVDGETSAFYAGNYFLCTMPEMLADAYGKRGAANMSVRLEGAMDRFLAGPCEPDLMFSAAELLYDYALVSGPNLEDYRGRIERAGPGKSGPWLVLVDNVQSDYDPAQALSYLESALATARANLDEQGDVISEEFTSELERQRTLLLDEQASIQTLRYRP